MRANIWKNGIMGVVVGDALGCPVQFESRTMVAQHPVTGMRGYGTFKLPPGSWTDDSSLTLALLESIRRKGGIDLTDIIRNQKKRWLSCSSKGNLNFNCVLMLASPEVIDSIVVHELCHRKQMNHSKASTLRC